MYIRYVYTKRKKLDKADGSLIDPYIPDNLIMAQAWVDCLRWSVTAPEILARSGLRPQRWSPGATPIERMIRQATGQDRGSSSSMLL